MIWIIPYLSKRYFSDSRLCLSKRKGFRLFQPKFLAKFSNWIKRGMGCYYLYFIDTYWGRPDFFSLFTIQKRSRFLKCIRTLYEKWYRDSGCLTRDYAIIRSCLRRVTYWAIWFLIWEKRFMLYRLISYHGSGVQNGWGFLFLISEMKGIRILR